LTGPESKYNRTRENDQYRQGEEVTLAELGSIGLAGQGELGWPVRKIGLALEQAWPTSIRIIAVTRM